MSELRLTDDGYAYIGDKHIATVIDGEIKYKHYTYKKHKNDIEYLLFGELETLPDAVDDEPEDEPEDETPATPLELFNTPDGKWYGEEAPEVVIWRSEHWSKKSFDEKYAHQEELLANNFAKCGMKYQPK